MLAEGIKAGASVKSGQAIGTVGETAISELADEPHLHFEMTVGGLSVDPLEYFSEQAMTELSGAEDTTEVPVNAAQ
jgi:murein DD-endopeptidase MepM/ murein hydrolase activator NlpD